MKTLWFVLLVAAGMGCSRGPEAAANSIDPMIAKALAETKAIDGHAHPVRPTAAGEAADTAYDALPVENLEAASDPVRFRPGRPEFGEASRAIFGGDRAAAARDWGGYYASRVLDKAGIDKMIANRVAMGEGLPRERFLWAAYADALMYPFPTEGLAVNSDRKAFFALESKLLGTYYREAGMTGRPGTLDEYLRKVVTATLERHKASGAVAEKFEMAYLRSLGIGNPSKAEADRAWRAGAANGADYAVLQDYLFRQIAMECGRLGMAVHFHTGFGAGGYYDQAGANPSLLEPLFNDPALRKTTFVMVHGGWPHTKLVTPLLVKPNAYVDISMQGLTLPVSEIAEALRTWLEFLPEKVLFGTDAYPVAPSAQIGWEETAYVSSQTARRALGMALTEMVRAGSVTRERAIEIGRLVLRGNAERVYGLK